MKTTLLTAAALGLVVSGALTAKAAADAPRAQVIFDHPDKFTDVRDQEFPTDRGRDAILKTLRDFIVREAGYQVPTGCKLTITFTDIDLAGKFEPWRGPDFDEIRIIKPIYPPDFKFTYVVTDAAGTIVKQGREDICDLAFQMRITLDSNDPLRYEKSILSDWMRSTLRGVRTSGS
jgi:DUF3016 family protein